jgi:hypothetical protein
LAQLLGYETWADYDAEVKMIKEGGAIPVFIEKIADAALESGVRDREVVLARMRADVPDATAIDSADLAYYANLVSKEQLEVDAQLVRTYLDFTKVRAGLLGGDRSPCSASRYEPARRRRPSGTRRSRHTTSIAPTGTSQHRADLPRPAPARGQVQARRAVRPRHRGRRAEQLPEGTFSSATSRPG